jgi:hypothetical protein
MQATKHPLCSADATGRFFFLVLAKRKKSGTDPVVGRPSGARSPPPPSTHLYRWKSNGTPLKSLPVTGLNIGAHALVTTLLHMYSSSQNLLADF